MDLEQIKEEPSGLESLTVSKLSEIVIDNFVLPDPETIARRAIQTKKMMAAACQVLSHNDIIDFGGNPYIDHLGCKKIANLFGLIVRSNEDSSGNIAYRKVIEDKDTNKFTVYITGRVWHKNSPENYEPYEGSCSSFNDFFSQWHEKKDGKVVSAKLIPDSKVQEKAITNFMQRAIKKILGLQFTWEELEEFGFERKKCRGFAFKGEKQPDTSETSELRGQTWQKLIEICGGKKDIAEATIQKHTKFTKSDGSVFEGYKDINKVSQKMLPKLAEKVNFEYEKYLNSLDSAEVKDA